MNSAGVRLRCWAAPPSITEEEVEDEIEEDAVSLRAMPVQGKLCHMPQVNFTICDACNRV